MRRILQNVLVKYLNSNSFKLVSIIQSKFIQKLKTNIGLILSYVMMFFRLGGSSTIFHEKNSTKRLSLLDFNLEPLTDTLEALDLSDNGLTGLPMQFESRSFARLRDLDLSHNPIKGKVVVV